MAILGSVALPAAADASDVSPDAVDGFSVPLRQVNRSGMNNLGILRCGQGDLDRSELWLRRAYIVVSRKVCHPYKLVFKTGHLDPAGVWCARAVEAGIPDAGMYLDDLANLRDVRRSSDPWELTNYLIAAWSAEVRPDANGWYEYLAQAGCPRAMARFGTQLLSRGERSQAWFWIERAAGQGIAEAMNTFASLIEACRVRRLSLLSGGTRRPTPSFRKQ